MKRIVRLLIDIVGGCLVVVGLGLCLATFLNFKTRGIRDFSSNIVEKIMTSGNKNFISDMNDGDFAHWTSLAGIMIGVIAIVIFIVTLFMIFRKKSHKGITTSLYTLGIISIGFGAWSFLVMQGITNLDGLKAFVNN